MQNQGFENVDIIRYKDTGEFLKADTLLLTRYLGRYRILVVDLSTFTTSAIHSVIDLNNIQTLQDSLRTELNYVSSKSSFCGLGIDTGNSSDKENKLNEIYSKELAQYFSAFKTKDKEAVKVIQACSYAWSFYKFLLSSGKILPGELDKGDKNLTFYLSDKAIYYPKKVDDNGKRLSANESEKIANLSLQESCLNILNILIILKASIMTRIMGSGEIGRKRYVIIPIGGKAISQAGETFIGSLATLLREIRKEFNKQPEDKLFSEGTGNRERGTVYPTAKSGGLKQGRSFSCADASRKTYFFISGL